MNIKRIVLLSIVACLTVLFQQVDAAEKDLVVMTYNIRAGSLTTIDSLAEMIKWVSRNLVGINFRHPNVMPNFAVWKTITYRHWHRWCCQPRF